MERIFDSSFNIQPQAMAIANLLNSFEIEGSRIKVS